MSNYDKTQLFGEWVRLSGGGPQHQNWVTINKYFFWSELVPTCIGHDI